MITSIAKLVKGGKIKLEGAFRVEDCSENFDIGRLKANLPKDSQQAAARTTTLLQFGTVEQVADYYKDLTLQLHDIERQVVYIDGCKPIRRDIAEVMAAEEAAAAEAEAEAAAEADADADAEDEFESAEEEVESAAEVEAKAEAAAEAEAEAEAAPEPEIETEPSPQPEVEPQGQQLNTPPSRGIASTESNTKFELRRILDALNLSNYFEAFQISEAIETAMDATTSADSLRALFKQIGMKKMGHREKLIAKLLDSREENSE